MSPNQNSRQTLRTWWKQREPREKLLLTWGGVALGAALLWGVALAPALRTLKAFDAKHLAQAAQINTMLRQQAQAQTLMAVPVVSQAQAIQALQVSVKQSFGTQGDVVVQAGQATVTLRGVSADALAQWLAAARTNARSVPVQARLARNAEVWNGTLQMGLPSP
jgi:general secretion pathway protein M